MRTFNRETMTITPRVWIGCLACYNAGELVGHWYDAVDAADVLPVDLHGVPTDHEELWVMDHEHIPTIPGRGEMDPYSASLWGRAIEAVSPQWRAAYIAYIEDQWIKDPQDAPTPSEFNEVFAGQFPDFTEFAEMIVRDCDLLYGSSETAIRYFDIESLARDLQMDYTVIDTDAPDYEVWVFHNV